jgi:glutamate transport system permease protein
VEFFTPRFGNEYTFQLYVAAGLIYILINVALSQLAKVVERRTSSNRKTAGTRPVAIDTPAATGEQASTVTTG